MPEQLVTQIAVGVRVEVNFGKNKIYSGIVAQLHKEVPTQQTAKPILAVLDEQPIVTEQQLNLWKWISQYYCCTIGEVMGAALPANLKLASETKVILSPLYDPNIKGLSDKEFMVLEALQNRGELSITEIRDIIEQKTVYTLLKKLLEKKLVYLKEDLQAKYKPKKIACVRLREPYLSEPELLQDAFNLTKRSEKQTNVLMAFIQMNRQREHIRKTDIYKAVEKADSNTLKAMEKKGVFELYDLEISRVKSYDEELSLQQILSEQQTRAIEQLNEVFKEKNVALLHGVTGSGKTRVYTEFIQQYIKEGKQVLYLLPEIALTTQVIERLQQIFGDDILVYHSRLSNNERVDIWKAVIAGKPIVLGARSSVFLPFNDLGLIIVDEEHDPSFKQNDPNPRYQGRDTAIYLAQQLGAKVILGTATPSIESYQNTIKQKYGLVEMKKRFGGIALPEIVIADMQEATKKKTMQSIFTPLLMDELKATIERKEQAILFQNRRGYAPMLHCDTCGWHQQCLNCDVSLTYHKYFDQLKCHYCGHSMSIPEACPACGVVGISMKGFGTEKIEDDIKIFLPEAKVARMDLDTARSKTGLLQILQDFEENRIDILVGTQMVTKGLDFENVGLVGILNADQLLHYPDFRASERGFQLMTQVSGRAGRKKKQGKVIIQTFNPAHAVIKQVIDNDFDGFFDQEITERKQFAYPPYIRLIRITLKHKRTDTLNLASKIFAQQLKSKLGNWVIGPAIPHIGRIRSFYLVDYWVKIELNPKKIRFAKSSIMQAGEALRNHKGCSNVRVSVDVDPG